MHASSAAPAALWQVASWVQQLPAHCASETVWQTPFVQTPPAQSAFWLQWPPAAQGTVDSQPSAGLPSQLETPGGQLAWQTLSVQMPVAHPEPWVQRAPAPQGTVDSQPLAALPSQS
jgi:hypothetical protein